MRMSSFLGNNTYFVVFVMMQFICPQIISAVSKKGTETTKAYQELQQRQKPAPKKILFWTSFKDYVERMDRFLYDMIDAGLTMDEIHVSVWGPGWPGWNKTITTNANVVQKFGYGGKNANEPYFDIAVAVSHHLGFHIEDPQQKTIFLYEIGDCHIIRPQECIDEIPRNAQIITSRYGHELLGMFHPQPPHLSGVQRLFYHISDCANPSLYHPRVKNFSFRQNVFVIGSIWSLYPVRVAAQEAIRKGLINNGKVLEHPGYKIAHINEHTARREYDPNSVLTKSHRDQQEKFAAVLGTSRICIFDSSIVRKCIRKFIESALSGCIIASDLPLEMWSELKPFVIELPQNASAHQIATIINSAQNDLPDLARRSAAGIQWARNSATCIHKIQHILTAVDSYRAGKRGYYFPHSVALDCYTTEDGFKLPWC